MSWSISTKIVPKSAVKQALEDLSFTEESVVSAVWTVDQLETAKRAALEIVRSMPGPYISVSLSGHANGIGWQGKEGWSNEYISVSVYQQTEEPSLQGF